MVVARKDDFCARIDRLSHRVHVGACRRALHRLESRLRALEARPGFAGSHGRLAMRGRHAAELTHELRPRDAPPLAAASGAQRCSSRWKRFDLRRRLGRIRARLVAADGRLAAASAPARHRADARSCAGPPARLEALSPLAVLGRGYAVCWNADRTAVIRDARASRPASASASRWRRANLIVR